MKWEKFEQDCYENLCERYDKSRRIFKKMGSSDSTRSDIMVELPGEDTFFVETKEKKAQCGQFVLHPNDEMEIFEYSQRNKTRLNLYSEKIIEYMNESYSVFRNAGTKGKQIKMDSEIFAEWIKDFYAQKSTRFFMSGEKRGYVIFPVEKVDEYFDITAMYRIKKSGSANLGKKDIPNVQQILEETTSDYRYNYDGENLFISTEYNLNRMKKIIDGVEYFFRENENIPNQYRVRKLSQTKNSNVIFSVELKKKQEEEDLIAFEKAIHFR